MSLGASSYFRKAEGREVLEDVFARIDGIGAREEREVLVVNAGEQALRDIEDVLEIDNLHAVYASSAVDAVDSLRERPYDCVIFGAAPSEVSASDLLMEMQKAAGEQDLIVVAYAPEGSPLPDIGLTPLREGAVVRRATSQDRLLSEITRTLHIPEIALPEYKRLKLAKLRQIDEELAGSKVLIVDDDVRNIFALTSILERHQVQVLHAENGRAGIDTLLQTPDVDVVLMDIMMPGMDGYETIRAIRELDSLRNTPIIAVTAKAMKGDREKCLESGASDYIAKPVDLDQLFSLMRVWTQERRQKASGAGITV
jgi:CheY-like chemotaxis protein